MLPILFLMSPKMLFLAENSREWQWSRKVHSLEEPGAALSGMVAFEPTLPETVESHPALSWEGAQLKSGTFPEGRGKPSGFSMCPPDPLGRTQNAYERHKRNERPSQRPSTHRHLGGEGRRPPQRSDGGGRRIKHTREIFLHKDE